MGRGARRQRPCARRAAGHAGLFAPLDDLVDFARHLLFLMQGAQTCHARRDGHSGRERDDVRGLGWRLDPKDWGRWPTDTLWHTGFTVPRCSSHITRSRVVLLTNAVHPYRRIAQQTEMRAAVHRRVSEALT